VEVPKYI
jgi:hypothetical protein